MKTCSVCNVEKDETCFSTHEVRGSERLQSWCKECTNAKNKGRYHTDEAYRLQVIERAKQYQIAKNGVPSCEDCGSPRPASSKSSRYLCLNCVAASFERIGMTLVDPSSYKTANIPVLAMCSICGQSSYRKLSMARAGRGCKCNNIGKLTRKSISELRDEHRLRHCYVYLRPYVNNTTKVGIGTVDRCYRFNSTYPAAACWLSVLQVAYDMEQIVLDHFKADRVWAGEGQQETSECLTTPLPTLAAFIRSHPLMAGARQYDGPPPLPIVPPCPPPSIPLSTSPRSDDVTTPQSPIGVPDEGNGSGS